LVELDGEINRLNDQEIEADEIHFDGIRFGEQFGF